MKMKAILLLSLVALSMQPVQAAKRKPAADEAAVTSKKGAKSELKKLFENIKNADLPAIKEQLKELKKEVLNEHDAKYSPLGLAQHELEMAKSKASALSKEEKTTRTRSLNGIIKQLKEHGASMIFHDGAKTAKAA